MSAFSSKIDTQVVKMNKNGKIELVSLKITVQENVTGFPIEQFFMLIPVKPEPTVATGAAKQAEVTECEEDEE